jgi:hypothetical protein
MVTALRSKWAAGPAAAHSRQHKGWDCMVRTFVPEGLSESRPVRSAGLGFLESIRPGRDDRRVPAIAEPRARPKAKHFHRP